MEGHRAVSPKDQDTFPLYFKNEKHRELPIFVRMQSGVINIAFVSIPLSPETRAFWKAR